MAISLEISYRRFKIIASVSDLFCDSGVFYYTFPQLLNKLFMRRTVPCDVTPCSYIGISILEESATSLFVWMFSSHK
jgi:hypothetical protein